MVGKGLSGAAIFCPHGDPRVFPGAASKFDVPFHRDAAGEFACVRKHNQICVPFDEPDQEQAEPP